MVNHHNTNIEGITIIITSSVIIFEMVTMVTRFPVSGNTTPYRENLSFITGTPLFKRLVFPL